MPDSHHKMLLAEEDRKYREHLAANLKEDGHEVPVAGSHQQALVLLCELMPGLLPIDVNGDRLTFVDAIHGGRCVAGRINPGVPIVVPCRSADELHPTRCLHRGADEIVAKPA